MAAPSLSMPVKQEEGEEGTGPRENSPDHDLEVRATVPRDHSSADEIAIAVAPSSTATGEQDIAKSPKEESAPATSFTWFGAAKLAFAVLAFFWDAAFDAKLIVDDVSAGNYWRGFTVALVIFVTNGAAYLVCFAYRMRCPIRHWPTLEHPMPGWFDSTKKWLTRLMMPHPAWYAQELYYGLRSKWTESGDEAKHCLELMDDLQVLNHSLRFLHGGELMCQLVISIHDLGPRLLEPWNVGAWQGGTLLFQLVGLSLAVDSMRFVIATLSPHKSKASSWTGRRLGPLLNVARMLGDALSAGGRLLIFTVYFFHFGFVGGATTVLVPHLSGTATWYSRSALFIVDWLDDAPRALRGLGSFFLRYSHANLLLENYVWDVSFDVAFDLVAMLVWLYFGVQEEERRWHHWLIAIVPVASGVLDAGISVLVARFERKEQ